MKLHREPTFYIVLLFFLSCTSHTGITQAHKDGIPSDFKVVAEYGAGYSVWLSWSVSITRDGRVSREVYSEGAVRNPTPLTEGDLKDLQNVIKKSDFYHLRKEYTYSVTDNPILIISVTMNKNTHKVSVYAPLHIEDEDAVKRFLMVWSEILKKVPSPNSDQTPDLPDIYGDDDSPPLSDADRRREFY